MVIVGVTGNLPDNRAFELPIRARNAPNIRNKICGHGTRIAGYCRRRRPGAPVTVWKLSWRLAHEQGFLLVIAVLTTLIAAAIAVGIPLYLGGIETATLEHEFSRYTEAQTNGWVKVRDVPFNPAAFDSIDDEVQIATSKLGDIGTKIGMVVRSAPFSVSVRDDDRFVPFTSVFLQVVHGGSSPLRFVSGAMPATGSDGVAIPRYVARRTGASVGDHLVLEAQGGGGLVDLVVTGVFEPKDTSAAYWTGISDDLLLPAASAAGTGSGFIGIVDERLLFSITPGISSTLGTGWWLISIDTLAIIRAGLGTSLARIDSFTLAADAVAPGGRAFAGAGAPLAKLRRDKSAQMVPVAISSALLLLVAGQVVLLASSVMTASSEGSIRQLGLRGGGPGDLLGFSSLSAMVVLVIPALLGPPLAWLIVPFLGTVDALKPLTNGSNLQVSAGMANFGISAVVGSVSAVLILLPGINLAARRKSSKSSASPSNRPPLIWRMKLDLLFVALSAVLIWEMDARGLLSTLSGRNELGPGWVMTSTGIVAVAAVLALVRIWPVVPRLGAGAAGRMSSITWYAVTSMLRSSFRHAWLLTLITIATVTAVTDSTIAASLEANGLFAASQAAGADARIAGLSGYRGESNPVVIGLAGGPEITGWVPALRTTAALGANGEGADFELLAVEPNSLGQILVDDSMRQSAVDAGGMLRPAAESTPHYVLALPADTESLRIIGQISEEFIDIWVRVKGADGTTSTVLMSPAETQDGSVPGQVFAGSVTDPANGPYELISILVYEPPVGPVGHAVTLSVDRLEALTASGTVHVISGPGGTGEWTVLPGTAEVDGSVFGTPGGPDTLLTVEFGPGTDDGIRGVHLRKDLDYLPLVMSPALQEHSGLNEGDTGFITAFGKVVPVRAVGTVDTFATLDTGSSFAIIDYRATLDYLSLKIDPVLPGLAELFVSIQPGSAVNIRSFAEDVAGPDTRVFVYEQLVDESTASAGASAGWKGMHFVVTAALAVLTATGLLLFIGHDFVETRRPSNVLSVLGVSRFGQAVEKLFRIGVVTLVGVGSGIFLGGLLGAFVATRITGAYTTQLADTPPRAATVDAVAAAYIVALVIAGLLGLFVYVMLRPERQLVGRQGGIG